MFFVEQIKWKTSKAPKPKIRLEMSPSIAVFASSRIFLFRKHHSLEVSVNLPFRSITGVFIDNQDDRRVCFMVD
jgi:hypothetical protein